jgi:hypothetical protein
MRKNQNFSSGIDPDMRLLCDEELDAVIGGASAGYAGCVSGIDTSPLLRGPIWDLVGLAGHIPA